MPPALTLHAQTNAFKRVLKIYATSGIEMAGTTRRTASLPLRPRRLAKSEQKEDTVEFVSIVQNRFERRQSTFLSRPLAQRHLVSKEEILRYHRSQYPSRPCPHPRSRSCPRRTRSCSPRRLLGRRCLSR